MSLIEQSFLYMFASLNLPYMKWEIHIIAIISYDNDNDNNNNNNSVALVRERTIPTERPPLVGEVSANYCVAYSAGRIPYGRTLGFLDSSRYVLFQEAPQLYSEAEWTPFQTGYFSESLVAPGIGPGPLDL
jgi:hypothetical protein